MTPEEAAARRAELQRQLDQMDAAVAPQIEDDTADPPSEEEAEPIISSAGPGYYEVTDAATKSQSTPEAVAAREAHRQEMIASFRVHYVPKSKIGDADQAAYCKEHGCSSSADYPGRFHAFPYWVLSDRKYSDAFKQLEAAVVAPSNGTWSDTGETGWERLCRLWAELGIEIPDLDELRADARGAYQVIDGKITPDYPDRVLIKGPDTWHTFGGRRGSGNEEVQTTSWDVV